MPNAEWEMGAISMAMPGSTVWGAKQSPSGKPPGAMKSEIRKGVNRLC